MLYLTIDGGTTNTRIYLVDNGKIKDVIRFNIGAGNDKEVLTEAIKNGISEILNKNNLLETHIHRILASGMITSEFGLYELPHALTPAGLKELKKSAEEVILSHICTIPFVFIRGVKTNGESLDALDMMRGEETEIMGLMQEGACLYLLMGSHTKLISTDTDGRISAFSTHLTGELAAAISSGTILKNSISLKVNEFDADCLFKGYTFCTEHGISKALFKVRIMRNLLGLDERAAYSFFMGCILSGEVEAVKNSGMKKIILGGNKQLRIMLSALLKKCVDAEIICLDDETVDSAVAMGALRIFESN